MQCPSYLAPETLHLLFPLTKISFPILYLCLALRRNWIMVSYNLPKEIKLANLTFLKVKQTTTYRLLWCYCSQNCGWLYEFAKNENTCIVFYTSSLLPLPGRQKSQTYEVVSTKMLSKKYQTLSRLHVSKTKSLLLGYTNFGTMYYTRCFEI